MNKNKKEQDEEWYEIVKEYPTQQEITEFERKKEEAKKKSYPYYKTEEKSYYFRNEKYYPRIEPKPIPPPPSKPRKIRLAVWDLDDTLWDVYIKPTPIEKYRYSYYPPLEQYKPKEQTKEVLPYHRVRTTGIISSCGLNPYKKIDDNTIENDLCRVVLREGVRDTLHKLKSKGIYLSIASKNNFANGFHALESFGLDKYFIDMQIGWESKDKMIHHTLDKLRNKDICIKDEEIIFLDDNEGNLRDVTEHFDSKPIVLQSKKQYTNAKEILKYIE